MKTLIKLFILIYLFVFFTSCHKDPPQTPIYTDQGSIGAQGGIVKTNDGASVEIPVGVLSIDKQISITSTTKNDTAINSGFKVYDLNPDGLTFTDSIIITLPFDPTFINLQSQEINYGIGVMIYQDSLWQPLKVKLDLINKTASFKTKHFSKYVIYFPTRYVVYFNNNRNSNEDILSVPYYNQGNTGWCSYYALSMVTRYAGYFIQAPFWAVRCNTKDIDHSIKVYQVPLLGSVLTDMGISSSICKIGWANGKELSGYLIEQLKKGFPIWVGSSDINHAIVITGHNSTGFYINDPSGTFLKIFNPSFDFATNKNKLAMILVPYSSFIDILFPQGGAIDFDVDLAQTIVIQPNSNINNKKSWITLNFPYGYSLLEIRNSNNSPIGSLTINPLIKPNGYQIVHNNNQGNKLDGSDMIHISPVISNSDQANSYRTEIHYLIDNEGVKGSPIILDVPKKDSWYVPTSTFKIQLANLSKGTHKLTIELRSSDNPTLKYDYWDFPFELLTEFIDNENPPNSPMLVSPTNGASGVSTSPTLSWSCTDPDGDALTYDVYFGTTNNPTTIIAPNHSTTSLSRTGLTTNTPYYWKVIAKDSKGATTSGPVWSFTTYSSNIPPVAGFVASSTNITAGQSVQFTDQSTNTPTSWSWNFGDGGTSTIKSPAHAFTITGTYTVSLTASNSFGANTKTITNYITVNSAQNTVTDIEGNIYSTITIGTQVWMEENLKTTKYNDGTAIPNKTVNAEWAALTTGGYSDYDNLPANSSNYGRLYNWFAVDNNAATKVASNGGKNVCPTNWHVPTDAEWTTLTTYLGGENIAGSKLKETGTSHWISPNMGATNEVGFTALAGGYRFYNGPYASVGSTGVWWSSTGYYTTTDAFFRSMYYNQTIVFKGNKSKQNGSSIRCVRDF